MGIVLSSSNVKSDGFANSGSSSLLAGSGNKHINEMR